MKAPVQGIYIIQNKINSKVYIGKSVNIQKRFTDHKHKLCTNTHKNNHLQASWNQYGEDNFTFSILEICEKNLLNDREEYWIDHYLSYNKSFGYNQTYGGDGGALLGDALEKMRKSLTGRKSTEEQRRRQSELQKGKKRTKEACQHISSGRKGIKLSEETKNKLSTINKGKKLSEETRKKMSNSRKGKPQSLVTCPYCGKVGGTTMYRWHFNRCKNAKAC